MSREKKKRLDLSQIDDDEQQKNTSLRKSPSEKSDWTFFLFSLFIRRLKKDFSQLEDGRYNFFTFSRQREKIKEDGWRRKSRSLSWPLKMRKHFLSRVETVNAKSKVHRRLKTKVNEMVVKTTWFKY